MHFFRNLCAVVLVATGALAHAQSNVNFPVPVSVGQSSPSMQVVVTMTAGGAAGTPQAVTQGVTGLDYSLASGSCSGSFNVGQTCTFTVSFSPKFPGLRSGAVIVPNANGGLLGMSTLSGIGLGGLGVLNPGRIDTAAGSSAWLYRGDGVPATTAQIYLPSGVTEDPAGNLYISDTSNNRIRKVNAQTQLISTIGGSGNPGYSGDGGPATQAMISQPAGIALDGAGNIYFDDTSNHIIRRIDAYSGIITTVAGTPNQQGYAGDNGLATSAQLSLPEGIVLDSAGNIYIADTGNNVVREVVVATGIIKPFAGTGTTAYNGDSRLATTASLNTPWGLALGLDGSMYIADLNNHRIRKVNPAGIITTVAGDGQLGFSGDGGPAVSANLNAPAAVAVDPAGNIYVADSGNDYIREVSVVTGKIQTIVGLGTNTKADASNGDTDSALTSNLYGPYSLFFDQWGNLFTADLFENRIRRISAQGITLKYDTIRVSKVSDPQAEGLNNDGNAPLTVEAPTLNQGALDPATTTCNTSTVMSIGASCNYGVEFAPTTVGNPITGTVNANTDAANSPAIITLTGQVLSVNPTSVALVSSKNPSLVGDTITFTATTTSDDASRVGDVVFLDGSTKLCDININANGIATCTVNTLTLGSHSITANYSGDANNASSVSPTLTQVVQQTPTLALSAGPNPAIVLQNVTLTVQATAPTGVPTGTITFYDGSTALGAVALDNTGNATLSTTHLIPGAHSLTAKYAGDATNVATTSNTVSEQINRADTTTTISTSNANVPVGTAVTFTASVSTASGPVPTGSVTFMDGTNSIGTVTLAGNGTAVLTTAVLTPGSHSIVASYSGDTDDSPSASSGLTETVQQLGTTTTLTSDANPANAGALIHLTAAVKIVAGAIADGTITGTVTFMDGTKSLGTASVDTNGNAVLPVSGLAVGNHAIVASYSGNTNYASSASPALSEVVQTTATTTVISSTSQNSLSGKSVTLSATITSTTGGIATGTVTFNEGGTVIGSGTLNAQGVATFTSTTLSVGSHSVIANYAGDTNYQSSNSAPYIQVISQATTGVTLAGPSAPVNAGLQVTMTAALTSNGVAPTGSLTLKEGATVVGTQNVTNTGTFTFNTSTLGIGTHTLTATYSGDTNSATSTSNAITVTIQQGPSATALVSSLNPAIVGQNVTFTATVTSPSPNISGSINFVDGASVLGSASVGANGVATFSTTTLPFGPHSITAVYSGDTNHVASTSAAISQSIVQQASAAVISSLNPSVSGNNVVFTAKISGVGSLTPTGKVTFTDGATTLNVATLDGSGTASFPTSTLGVGSHTISISYAGDTNFSTATASLIQTVGNANTSVTLTSSANPATYGTPISFTAVIASNGGVATGKVIFTEGGTAIGSGVLDGTGTAVMSISTLSPTSHTIIANYAGDGKASASVSTPLIVVVKQATSVSVLSSNNPEQTLTPITFTAAIKNSAATVPTGIVTFVDGTTNLGTATLDANGRASVTVSSMSAGTHPITVSYVGDSADFTSVSQVLQQVVNLRQTTTALSSSLTDATNPNNVTLIGVVHWNGTGTAPTGKITFVTGTTTIGSSVIDSTGVATLTITLDVPTESVVATYSGDQAYATSDSIATTISAGTATQFKMALDPSTITLQSKQRTTINLTLTSVKDYADMMQFGCLGLPYAATCTFSQTAAQLNANGTTTIQVIVDTGNPLGEGTGVASNTSARGNGIVLAFLPAGLLAGLVLLRNRKRAIPALLLAVFALAATMGVTGCSGLQGSGTPAGNYAVKITASGKGTGTTQAIGLALNVTQ